MGKLKDDIQLLRQLRDDCISRWKTDDGIATIKAIDDAICFMDEAIQNEGVKMTKMTNAEWCLANGHKFTNIRMNQRSTKCGGGYYAGDNVTKEKLGQIVGTTCDSYGAFRAWLDAEHEDYKEPEPILTSEERGYLKRVIAPFREYIDYITVWDDGALDKAYGYMTISFKTQQPTITLSFPYGCFKKMEESKEYTLEELGL